MENVVLPAVQIPFMFGMLDNLDCGNNNVKLSIDGSLVSVDDYFENEIPKLAEKFEKLKIYLPLSNIYLFGRDKNIDFALDYLIREVVDCSASKDYRGIKFCCKLISMCDINKKHLNNIYRYITNIGASLEPNSTEMKNFSRNIGEIRNILFTKKRIASLFLKFKTNIGIEKSERFADLINRFQNIAKPNRSLKVKFSLEYNSPLFIAVEVEGDESWFSTILRSFLIVSNISQSDIQHFPIINSLRLPTEPNAYNLAMQYADESLNSLTNNKVEVVLLEYYVEGCDTLLKQGEKNFYMHQSMYEIASRSLNNAFT